MPLELPHTPFSGNQKRKDLDGVYRNNHDDSVAIFKNTWRKGYIKEVDGCGIAYDAITTNLNSEVHGKIKRCLVNMDDWRRILE